MPTTYPFYRFFLTIFSLLSLATLPLSTQAQRLPPGSTCPVVTGNPYRSPDVTTVFVITPDCKKRPIFNPDVYFSHFENWNKVIFLERYEVDAVRDHELKFLPWGPRRTFQNGSLVKTTDDSRVYFVQDGKIHPIESEQAFKDLGLSFSQVEDVTSDVLAKFTKQAETIKGSQNVPTSIVFKYPDDSKVYVLKTENGIIVKEHLATMEEVKQLVRPDRIIILPKTRVFEERPHVVTQPPAQPTTPPPTQNPPVTSPAPVQTTPTSTTNPPASTTPTPTSTTLVSDTTAPTVSFTSPVNASTVSGTIMLAATASDNVGVVSVRFEINSTAILTDTSSPYSASLNTTASANAGYILHAIATDAAGNETRATRTIVISNVSSPTVPTSTSGGISYYVSDCQTGADTQCVTGNDANSGTSPSAPWQTFSKAISKFKTMKAGDRILFAKGGSFQASGGSISNLNCRAANPCVMGDYTPVWATGDEGRPILTSSGTLLSFSNGGNSEHDEGYVVRNIALRGGGAPDSMGIFFYNDVDDVTLDNLDIQGFDLGVHCTDGNSSKDPGSDGKSQRITLKNSLIANNYTQGFLGGCIDALIENNDFIRNGGRRAILDHNVYISSPINMIFRNNRLYQSTMVGGKCTGVSLVVHGHASGLLIEGNTVREDVGAAADTCWGIAVDPGYSSAEDFRGTIIRGNTVINVGNMGIGAASCPDCVIENNLVIHEQPHGIEAIAVPNRKLGTEDTPDNHAIVRNNSIYIGPASSGGTGIKVGGTQGDANVIVSNAIFYAGTGSFSCFSLGRPTTSYDVVDHNLCYAPNAVGSKWGGGMSLADWRTSKGFDLNSINADPKFMSPASPSNDLTLGANSPAINAGYAPQSSSVDRIGKIRDTNSDIGAYER